MPYIYLMPKDDKTRARLIKRNTDVKIAYNELAKKNPKWRHDALVEDLADRFYISESTVDRILGGFYDNLWHTHETHKPTRVKTGMKPTPVIVQSHINFDK